jgi:DNA topoisomerase-1
VAGPGELRLRFPGKSGRIHELAVHDPRLVRIVRKLQDLPGQELFAYPDEDGEIRTLSSDDVNDYLREVSGTDVTAKDFRTWAGTVLAATALREFEEAGSAAQAKKNVLEAIEAVAGMLGNTRAVCRKSYIHPAIIDSYMDGSMLESLRRRGNVRKMISKLRPDEVAVLTILQQRIKKAA